MTKQTDLDRSYIDDNRLNGARGVAADVEESSINAGEDGVFASLKFAGVRHRKDETKGYLLNIRAAENPSPFYNPEGMLSVRPPTCTK